MSILLTVLKIEEADRIQEVESLLCGWGQGSSLDTNMVQQNQQPEVTGAWYPDPSVHTYKGKGGEEYGQSHHLC